MPDGTRGGKIECSGSGLHGLQTTGHAPPPRARLARSGKRKAMTSKGLEALDTSAQKTNIWINGVTGCIPGLDRHHAYSALRAVLHALRDRLSVDLAAHLGAQLPTFIRGVFYEGWHPAGKPLKVRNLEEFLAHIEQELPPEKKIDSEDAARAVFRVMEQHVDPGEIEKVVAALPKALRELWGPAVEPRDT